VQVCKQDRRWGTSTHALELQHAARCSKTLKSTSTTSAQHPLACLGCTCLCRHLHALVPMLAHLRTQLHPHKCACTLAKTCVLFTHACARTHKHAQRTRTCTPTPTTHMHTHNTHTGILTHTRTPSS